MIMTMIKMPMMISCSLSLSNNHLKHIANHTFRGLSSLTTLNLDYNDVSRLEPEALSGLGQLENLSLAFNLLSSSTHAVPPGVFRPVGATLKTLYFHGNRIMEQGYPDAALADLVALKSLTLYTFQNYGDPPLLGPGTYNETHTLLI
jgi:Leucine-rich repeat (LRR) protein